ncbi:MAG: recombinase family protein [Lachnospiraceae bacterium]|nr:recombinase family protein [Lachnospiraceae bacterium]
MKGNLKKNMSASIGIYARKSKFTGKGKSVQNQIKICTEYARNHLMKDGGEINIEIYKDEGISGKDIVSRPGILKLISDIEQGKIQIVICYRLDRISRNVKDFSGLVTKMSAYSVGFISVNEAFDTRTPMGRAMMYIASVFAQLERETITERITDNMYALAKTGCWLGGRTPLGFGSTRIEETDSAGRKTSRYFLEEKENETDIVKFLYYKYLELGSLTKLETYLLNNNYHTRDGKLYGRYTLKSILSNPVYCVAGEIIYKYLVSNGYSIYAEQGLFDGTRGLMAYNKNNCKAKGQRVKNPQDWIIATGIHKGIIPQETWIKVQSKLKNNSGKSYRYPKTIGALLSGIVRCGGCGSFMRPKGGRTDASGEKRYYYQCECKEKSKGNLCQMPNIPGNILDKMAVVEILNLRQKLLEDYSYLQKEIEKIKYNIKSSTQEKQKKDIILKQIKDYSSQETMLLDALGKSSSEAVTMLILKKLDEVTAAKSRLQQQYNKEFADLTNGTRKYPCHLYAESIITLNQEAWELISPARQKDILKMVIKEIVWDGKNAIIHLCAENTSQDFPATGADKDGA